MKKGRENTMNSKTIKKIIGNNIARMAIKITRTEINSTCVLLAYQPKLPESASKLKKN